ncbi:hypothetical protein DFP72DRAFT_856106 [Ephemerocybe angulata]|uniref:Uncharacterized protein n=1 Tax=Ephemerocybe angulata TaxID=980116 RepID=A0A8H6LVQ8_9AGAR|nr:hypothetical protein DFP72DRAFT_856106 [Tulosesus angulatus]
MDVLRACHIVPHFQLGRRYADGVGKSLLARDGLDWKSYFIDRLTSRILIPATSAGMPQLRVASGFGVSLESSSSSSTGVGVKNHPQPTTAPSQQSAKGSGLGEKSAEVGEQSTARLLPVVGDDASGSEGEEDASSDDLTDPDAGSGDSDSGESRWAAGYDSEDGRDAALYGD